MILWCHTTAGKFHPDKKDNEDLFIDLKKTVKRNWSLMSDIFWVIWEVIAQSKPNRNIQKQQTQNI